MTRKISRRHVLFGGALAAGCGTKTPSPAAKPKTLVILIDGFGVDYVEASDMPNLKRMGQEGGYKVGSSIIPSVTNVNNASLVTSSFPSEHGITTNYRYDPKTKEYSEMESSEFLLRPTIFERAKKVGMRSALVTSKDKVRTLCARGADLALSAEKPDRSWVDRLGEPEKMYTAGVNYWTFRAAREVLKKENVDLVYLSTTDYMMHTYPPEAEQSLEHLHTLDKLLGDIVDDNPGLRVFLTADHGMNAKAHGLNPALVLRAKSIPAEAVPIIRDKHQVHHNNLGGACYIYLERASDRAKAMDILKTEDGVEEVFDSATAAAEFHLHPERIGDIFLLAKKEYAFGQLQKVREPIKVRTHGSRYESHVPLLVYGFKPDMSRYHYNLDLSKEIALA